MDTKQYASQVVIAVAAAYTLLLVFRYPTRLRARKAECALVYLLLLTALIVLPVLFGAV